MSSTEVASAYLHGIHIDVPNDPPPYNEVMKMSRPPTAPPLEARLEETSFSSIFGVATIVQFEHNASSVGSFLIRDLNGSLQAKGDTTTHHIVVQNVNGTEMLKIIERSVDQVNRAHVHTYAVVHNHTGIGTIKVTESSSSAFTSLQILRGNGIPITVNSLRVGDYAIFRNKLSPAPMCNIQMPNVEATTDDMAEFNVKIIFHPHTGITEEEQLLCTAAAIAFKTTMKQKVADDDRYAGTVICILAVLGAVGLLIVIMNSYSIS